MQTSTEYIFSINAGRSGSNYLMNIFRHVVGCIALHEPKPRGNGKVMRCYDRGYLDPMKQCVEEKIKTIREVKLNCQVYAETSHCFIKGFGWFIPQYFPQKKIGVVVLKRDTSKIIESYTRLHCSVLNPLGRRWISLPDMQNPFVSPPELLISAKATYRYARFVRFIKLSRQLSKFLIRKVVKRELPLLKDDELKHLAWNTENQYPEWLKQYELDCLQWYIEEMDRKTEAFMRKYPDIKYYTVHIEELSSLDSVLQMLDFFHLEGKDSLSDILGKPTNLKR
jgi:hypothetical protein